MVKPTPLSWLLTSKTIFGAARGILPAVGVIVLGKPGFTNWATPMAHHTDLRELREVRKGHDRDLAVSYRGYVSQARLYHAQTSDC